MLRPFQPAGNHAALGVRDVIALYLKHTEHEQAPAAFVNCSLVLNEFADKHGDLALGEAKPFHLQLWVDENRHRWKSAWTRSRVIGSVLRAFNWSAKLGIIDRNPFNGVGRPTGERGTPMEPREFQAMLRASSAVFRRLLIFLRFTGARPGEASDAEWAHLDAERACIELPKHKTERRTRTPRRIMLHAVVLKLLAWIRRNGPDSRFIFVNAKRRPWTRTAIAWRVKMTRKLAGVSEDTTLYGLRHLHITQCIVSGIDLPTVAELAGHQRIATTMHYAHVGSTDRLRNAIQQAFKL